MTTASDAIERARSLDDLYPVLAANHLTAGWHKKKRSLWKEPATSFRPLHWRYSDARLAMDRAGQWMSTEDAERRNLLTFNPVADNEYDTVRTIVSAYQMIKPGEHARAHRHSPNALRLMLDGGPGVFTVVDGRKIAMRPGDVLLTPNWCWHSHFNDGASNAYWIDFLDVPLVHRLEPMFAEELPAVHQAIADAPDPDHCDLVFSKAAALAALERRPVLPGGGKRLALATQGHIPTLGIGHVQLPAGASIREGRTTANRIFAVVGGTGSASLGDASFAWSRGDLFCLPAWRSVEIGAATDALILEVSDEPTQRLLGFFREETRTDA